MYIYHERYGVLTMTNCEPFWQHNDGTLFGSFFDGFGQFMSLPLSEVTVQV